MLITDNHPLPASAVTVSIGGGGNCGEPGNGGPPTAAGVVNTGGGAGAGRGNNPGTSGGSGLVLVVEKCQAADGKTASGVWSMNTVFDLVKSGCWTGFSGSTAGLGYLVVGGGGGGGYGGP